MDRRTWTIAVVITVIVSGVIGAAAGYAIDTAMVLRQPKGP